VARYTLNGNLTKETTQVISLACFAASNKPLRRGSTMPPSQAFGQEPDRHAKRFLVLILLCGMMAAGCGMRTSIGGFPEEEDWETNSGGSLGTGGKKVAGGMVGSGGTTSKGGTMATTGTA
jgi:hypothetical protein